MDLSSVTFTVVLKKLKVAAWVYVLIDVAVLQTNFLCRLSAPHVLGVFVSVQFRNGKCIIKSNLHLYGITFIRNDDEIECSSC